MFILKMVVEALAKALPQALRDSRVDPRQQIFGLPK